MSSVSRSQSRFVSQAMRLRNAKIQHPRISSVQLLERAKATGNGNSDIEVGALRDIVKDVCRAYGRLLSDHLDSIDAEADQPADEQLTDMARSMAIADHRQAITDLARQYKGFDDPNPAILDMLNPPKAVEGPDIHDSRDYGPITPMDSVDIAEPLLIAMRGTPVEDDLPPRIGVGEQRKRFAAMALADLRSGGDRVG